MMKTPQRMASKASKTSSSESSAQSLRSEYRGTYLRASFPSFKQTSELCLTSCRVVRFDSS